MRYATKKEMEDLTKVVTKLASQMEEMARWQAYNTIRLNPLQYNAEMRTQILEGSKGHITYALYLALFRAYPI